MTQDGGRGGTDKKLRFVILCVYLAILLAIAYLCVKYLLGWVMPFILGFAAAAAVQPAVRYLHEKKRANKKAVSVLLVLLLIAVILFLTVFGVSRLVMASYAAAKRLPELAGAVSQALEALAQRISPFLCSISDCTGIGFDTSLQGITTQILKLSQLPQAILSFLHGAVSSVPLFLFDLIITIVSACFIAADYTRVTSFLLRCLPARYREAARELKAFFITTVLRLCRAYLILMLVTFFELSAGLLLLRVPHAVLIAGAIAVVDILPVLGTGTVMIPWAAAEFLIGEPYLGAGLALTYAVVTVVRNILEPRVVGSHIGLHPLVTLVSMVVGLNALGVPGMVIFPLTVLILKHLYESGIIKLRR